MSDSKENQARAIQDFEASRPRGHFKAVPCEKDECGQRWEFDHKANDAAAEAMLADQKEQAEQAELQAIQDAEQAELAKQAILNPTKASQGAKEALAKRLGLM